MLLLRGRVYSLFPACRVLTITIHYYYRPVHIKIDMHHVCIPMKIFPLVQFPNWKYYAMLLMEI